jgi:ribosome-binding protein aMBF1 (putative translation factor)
MVTATASAEAARSDFVSPDPQTRIAPRRGPDLLHIRKRELAVERLKLAREIVLGISTAVADSWKVIIQEVLDAGVSESTLETELAASRNTIYKWRNGLSSPREMTRRLLKRALVEVLDTLIANDP